MMLKKLLFFMICFLSAELVKAQDSGSKGRNFEKGKYIVGLNGSGSYSNGYLSSGHAVSLSPWAGYFVAKNLAAGVRLSYGRDVLNGEDPNTTVFERKIHSVAPEIFVRYYAPKIKVKPFVQLAVGYNFQGGVHTSIDNVKASNAIGSLEGGVLFPLGRKLSLDVSYNWRALGKSRFIDANKNNSFRLGLSFSL